MASFNKYLKQAASSLAAGNSTEHTFRPALKELIESLENGIVATNEPKRIECGAPDYIITKGQTPVGYIEAKDIGKSLDEAESTDQMRRYRESLSNLILTNYLEFRWYVCGEHRMTVRLANLLKDNKIAKLPDNEQQASELLNLFLHEQAPIVKRPKELAERMAHIARLIRDTIDKALNDEDKTGALHQQMEGFRKTLLHELTEAQFADMYAQTICYGLFAARCNAADGPNFTREHAAYDLPKTNPFLRKMFSHIAGPDLDDRITWAVDDVANLLAHADMEAILADFGKRTKRTDPVVHFYETFLAEYDPKMREARGVYYTPEPVVSYIVRSVDHILKTDFNLPGGLADSSKVQNGTAEGLHKVQILDPAVGTGTFLHDVIDHIHESFAGNKGMWSGYVRDHLLPRLIGFELLMAPYAVTHMKLGLQLAETGYDFQSDERLRVYLTNTLDEAVSLTGHDPFSTWLVDEANSANNVKKDVPIMVVLGNPPYSGHSANKGAWIAGLLRGKDTLTGKPTENYFEVDGKPLGEKNPKWLNDDYVKFIRFAQWRIEQTGYGVLAFITNHGYLDNPTFRGMRQSLMNTFDHIYVYDLHGNSKKKETAPDGGKDENVFDIQQGVAIGIFVKHANGSIDKCKVCHAELWGNRNIKYELLREKCTTDTEWAEIIVTAPHYLFVNMSNLLASEYDMSYKVTDIFGFTGEGFTSHRDAFAVAFTQESAHNRLNDFLNKDISDQSIQATYGISDTKTWNLSQARKNLQVARDEYQIVNNCLYRPFDYRYCLLHSAVMDRPRENSQRHMKIANLALATTRGFEIHGAFNHIFCADCVMDRHAVSMKEINYLFPLYLYPTKQPKTTLFDVDEPSDAPGGRKANLAPEFIADFAGKLKMEWVPDGKGDRVGTFGPEDVFAYMYAVFHSPEYRSRYAEFLKIDFPRLPLTSNPELFCSLCAIGDRLVPLHLMDKRGANLPGFPEAGSDKVEYIKYTEPDTSGAKGRVWINKEQYFDGVSPEIWNFHIGGYQVCEKWLKDRKNRVLSYDDLETYRKIVSILDETNTLMPQIDEAINSMGGWPLT